MVFELRAERDSLQGRLDEVQRDNIAVRKANQTLRRMVDRLQEETPNFEDLERRVTELEDSMNDVIDTLEKMTE
jgi:predicted nuclease with TOPRIM domain